MSSHEFRTDFNTALNLSSDSSTEFMLNLLEKYKTSQAIIRVIADYSIESYNTDVFLACMKHIDKQTVEYLFSNEGKGRYWMIYRLLKKIQTPSAKIMSSLLHNIRIDFNELDMSSDDILSIQDCCAFIKEQGMTFTHNYTQFLNTMCSLREKRRKRAKENMYWLILQNVTCNPDHPIGKKRVNALALDFNNMRGIRA